MSTFTDVQDSFIFTIPITTIEEERGFHRKNNGNEVQRPDVIDHCCVGLLLVARIDRIIHGWESEGKTPATLVVFGFRFHGLDEKRRFKHATITITFQDEQKRPQADPEVVALWPNGSFILGTPTDISMETTRGGEAGLEVTAGSGIQGGAHAIQRWEQKQSYNKTDQATLTGSIILDTNIREYGPNNAVRITLKENSTTASGLITDFRAAILLRRTSDSEIFVGTVKVKAKANFLYNSIRGIRDLMGLSQAKDDPIRFQPGRQFVRPGTSSRLGGEGLAENIDEENLSKAQLGDFGGILNTTVLS
ncbi:hypothetical protein TrVFT333_005421 [Trichoderma virens FT-333]|nr:hypothetical protein TrVFT333_005421 [Trichoderma virens FT-333]